MPAPANCDRCPALVKCRKTVVGGWGNPNARFAFVGQNPGKAEDEKGRPFIGPAGRVLATMIRSADINVDDVFLTNAARCWPGEGNRKPRKDEWSACRDFLLEELGQVKPQVIIALGEVAAHTLYGRTSLDAVLGQTLVQEELGVPLIVTYHPAFVLRGQWNAVPLILSHFEKAKRIVAGTQTLGELGEYAPILTIENLRLLRDYLLSSALLSLDCETTSLEWKDGEILCISFATEPGEGYVVPILQQGGDQFWSDAEQAEAMSIIGEILASPVPKALQGGAFDIRFLEREPSYHITAQTAFGWKVNNLQQDTMLMHRLTHEYLPKESTPNELPHLLSAYSDMPGYEAEIRTQSKNKIHMEEVENLSLWEYAAADADAVARLVPILGKQLDEDGDSRWIYENVSIPMVRCCQEMTRRGMLVDQDYFTSLCEYYEKKAGEIEKRLFGIVGREFNPNSRTQVQDVLFRELALPMSGRKTDASSECDACDKGACEKHDQVGEDALLAIKAQVDHPIIDTLIEWSKIDKRRSTYLAGTGKKGQGFLAHIRRDGRIHPEFKSGGAETGRISSQNPNGMNIPQKVEIPELETKNAFRRTFVAPPGHVSMEADWSQAEVWVTAYKLAKQFGDRTLLEILESGRDVHTVVGRAIWPVDLGLDDFEWAKEHDKLRTDAKVFTFGITFGLTVEGIMERLHCSREDAQRYLMSYLEMAPGLRDYTEDVQRTILAGDPLVNKFGRHRHFPQVEVMKQCNAKYDLEEMFREGVNFPIQSGASDLHSLAHIDTESNPKMHEVFRIIDAVHDSCLAEVPAPDLATVLETAWMVKHLWQEIALNTVLADGSKLGWQIPVEVSWGKNWGDMTYVLTARGGLLYRGQPVQTDLTQALPVA